MRALVALLLVAGWGCSTAAASTEEAVLTRYNQWVGSLECLTGGGKAWVGGEGHRDRAFRFSLALQGRDQFRLQGRLGALAQVFDLTLTPSEWTLYLPQAREVVRGHASEAVIELLNPHDFLAALMPVPAPVEKRVVSREGTRVRVVLPPDSRGDFFHRVVDVDSKSARPVRMEIRESSRLEAPLLVVRYAYAPGEDGFPHRIEVEREGAWARMEFRSHNTCESLDPRRFRIRIPHGVTEIPVDQLGYEFLPEAEESP